MAGPIMITDPTGTNGADPQPYIETIDLPCTVAVTEKMFCSIQSTDDLTLTCRPADTDVDTVDTVCGVALNSGAIGQSIRLVIKGPVIVITPATGPSAGEGVIMTSTAGTADGIASGAGVLVNGTYGVFMTDEIGTTNTSVAWIRG